MSEQDNNQNDSQNSNSKNIQDLESRIENLESDLSKIEEEKEEYLNGWKRTKADFQNYKKEEGARIEKAQKRAKKSVITALLPILDSLRNGLSKATEESREDSWVEGFNSIQEQLHSFFKNQSIELVEPTKGEKFDPKKHEAISVEQGSGEDRIKEVLQVGYKFEDELLRAARVKVGNFDKTNNN